ncbi:MAG: hypothetical protein ACRD2C_04250 [Acidimicrobiales bacterium]
MNTRYTAAAERCPARFSLGGGTPVRCLDPAGHPGPHEYAPDDDGWVVTWDDTATSTEPVSATVDVAAQEVCRGIQLHLSHNGALPWPTIRRPYDRWHQLVTGAGDSEAAT